MPRPHTGVDEKPNRIRGHVGGFYEDNRSKASMVVSAKDRAYVSRHPLASAVAHPVRMAENTPAAGAHAESKLAQTPGRVGAIVIPEEAVVTGRVISDVTNCFCKCSLYNLHTLINILQQ
jgi:hypothetical protein